MAVPLLVLLDGCGSQQAPLRLAGESMGTSWHVTVIPEAGTPAAPALQKGIEDILEAINLSMSTYREDSEISRFNATPVDQWFGISTDFYTVLSSAMAIGWQSRGAYDVTVGPLVEQWGFGPGGPVLEAPSDDAITDLLEHVGQDHLRLDGDSLQLLKRSPVSLDLA